MRHLFWNLHSLVYDIKIDSHVHKDLQSQVLEELTLTPNDILIDAGCGTGALEISITNSGRTPKQVIALDHSNQMINRARKKLADKKLPISFINADLNKTLPFKTSSVSKIACSNVLYNLTDPNKTLKEFFRVLKPGGKLVFTEPKPNARGREIAKAHFKNLSSIQKVISFVKSLLIILPFELIIRFIRQESAYFFEREKIDTTLKKIGFKKWVISVAYANQNWLVKTTK